MGMFSDILEVNRERECDGYIDPCMIMSSLGTYNKRITDCRAELNKFRKSDKEANEIIQQEFLQRSLDLEKLKSGYLIAEKVVLEIENRRNIQSVYMKDMLDMLQFQLHNAYNAICQLRSEINQKFEFKSIPSFQPDSEVAVRMDVLDELINTTLHHMEQGLFIDTSTFRKVVSDCAEIIRCMKCEEYGTSDKAVFSYYLMETVGLKPSQHKCPNCGKPLLNNIVYCINCYERNV